MGILYGVLSVMWCGPKIGAWSIQMAPKNAQGAENEKGKKLWLYRFGKLAMTGHQG
jgi:hypothetical protein